MSQETSMTWPTLDGAFWHQHLVMSPLVCISPQQVSLGFWLVSLTQQKGVFLLLCTFSQEAWKSSLVCGITLEVWERGSVLLIPNHGHNSISIQSLALTQSISNWTIPVKANPDQDMANQIPDQLGKIPLVTSVGIFQCLSEHPRALQGPKNHRTNQSWRWKASPSQWLSLNTLLDTA